MNRDISVQVIALPGEAGLFGRETRYVGVVCENGFRTDLTTDRMTGGYSKSSPLEVAAHAYELASWRQRCIASKFARRREGAING